jgi:hypothetical protein
MIMYHIKLLSCKYLTTLFDSAQFLQVAGCMSIIAWVTTSRWSC